MNQQMQNKIAEMQEYRQAILAKENELKVLRRARLTARKELQDVCDHKNETGQSMITTDDDDVKFCEICRQEWGMPRINTLDYKQL